MNIGKLIATLGVDTAALAIAEKEFADFEKKIDQQTRSINASLEKTGKAMKSVGKTMTASLTLPLVAVGAGAFKLEKDFEAAMTKITSLVGVSEKQVQSWKEEVLDLGTALGKSPKELADALFFVTSAGIRGKEAMDVLTSSAKASAIGLGETKVVADLVTSAMNAYGIKNLKAAKATDILITAVKEGKAEATELAQSMGQVLPIASEMGVTFDQVGAAIAAMTRTGTDAATASIQLRQILASMLKPSQQAEKAMNAMGTSSKELRDVISKQGLVTALQQLKNLTNVYGKEMMANVFPNIRALSGVLDLMGKNAEENIAIFDSLKDSTGALEKGFAATAKTAEFKYNQAISAGKTALTALGKELNTVLIPLLVKLTGVMNTVTAWFRKATEAQKKMVLIVGGIAAAIGPVLTLLGILIGSVLPKVVIGVTALVKAFKLLRLAMISNPIGAIITGLTALAAILWTVRKRTKEASDEQKTYNTLLQQATQLIGETQTIKARMALLKLLSKSQVSALETRIAAQLELEKEYTTELQLEAVKRIKEDKRVLELQKQASQTTSDLVRAGILRQTKLRKLAIIQDLGAQRKANKERIKELESYLAKVQSITFAKTKAPSFSRTAAPAKIMGKPLGNIPNKPAFDLGAVFSKEENDRAGNYAETVNTIMSELTIINGLYEIMGNTFDENAAKVDLYQQALEGLLASGFSPNSDEIQNIIGIMEDLDKTQNRTFKGMMRNISNVANVVGNSLMGVLSELGNLMNAQRDSQLRATEEMAIRAGWSEEKLAKQRDKINKEFAKKQKRLAIIQAIINTALAVTTAIATIPPPAGYIAAGLSAATGAIQIAAIKRQPLANGGIVPSGYPNDSYPALLTSGETVVPAKKLPDFSKSGGIDSDAFEKSSSDSSDKIVAAINNRPEQNITPVGVVTTVNSAAGKTEFIDTTYRN